MTDQPTDGREALNVDLIAAAVHEGRFPDGKASPIYCSFDDERDGGKEYCRRIARSVMAAQPISPQTKLAAAEKLAKRVLAYLKQPTGVPPSSNMECDCELYFLATDFLDAAPAALSAPRVEAPVPQPTSPRDREIMGTSEAAKQTLIEKAREWRRLRQPSMDTRAGHRKTEDEEREARFQLANAALLWLWHEENPL